MRETAPAYGVPTPARPAVEVDAEEYAELRCQHDLYKGIIEGLEDIEAGRVVPHEEAMAELLAKYRG